MSRTPRLLGAKVLAALVVAVVATAALAALVVPAGALTGPSPAGPVTLAFTTPVSGLAQGAAVSYNVNATGGAVLNGGITAHICETGAGINNSSNFGYQGPFCVKQAGISSGGLTGGDYQTTQNFSGVTSATPPSFHAGVGTVTWIDDLFGLHTITCGPGNPCDLVVQVNINQAPNTVYFTQPLSFAGSPAAPTALAAAGGNTSAALTWTAGNDGGNPITNYQVNVTPAPGAGNCASGTCLTGTTGTSFGVTGLTNFTAYSFTVQAVNAIGTGPVSNTASATPGPAGPTGLGAAPRDSAVDLSWNAVAGATNYRVTVTPAPGGASNCATGSCLTGGTGTTFSVTGLTNGTSYTFSVAAQVGANFTAESNQVAAAPGGALIRQGITATRPAGTLVISQYCSGQPTDLLGSFDPSNSNGTAVPNTLCSFTLSGLRTSRLFPDAISGSGRTVHDAVTNGTTTVASPTIAFVANDVNQLVTGTGIPVGTRIVSVTSATTAVLSNAATVSFDGGDFTIVGTTLNFGTVAGLAITPSGTSAFAAGDVNKEIEGLYIPGGSTITNVVNATVVDVSAPADGVSNGFAVREWLQAPTPAKLLTTGPHAGQYFEATGQLRQVMIVDTRTADTGWTATGAVSDFSDGTHTFSGDYLGWSPKAEHAFSQPFTGPSGAYSMSPANGGAILPGTVPGLATGTSASTDTLVAGNVPGATLAYAGAGHGLGLAELDASLDLWIPVNSFAGVYTATLTLTAI